MKAKTPDSRLRAAAGFVRQGAVLADIGTDHAFLPVFLFHTGRIARAYAADINEGPLLCAKRHIAESGFSEHITTVLTDGLTGLENAGITDIAICGMGGELIVDILRHAPFVKDTRIRLILQPMTRAAHLREYLAREGFAIVGECVTRAQGKLYFCLAAEYTGVPYTLSRIKAELGQLADAEGRVSEDELLMVDKHIRAARRRVEGYRTAARPDMAEEEYLETLIRKRSQLL